jgi:hypothetical protein
MLIMSMGSLGWRKNQGALEKGESAHGARGHDVLIEGVTQVFPSTIGTKDLNDGAVILRARPCLRLLEPGNASLFAARINVGVKHVSSSVGVTK